MVILKEFKTYSQQLDILVSRGMDIGDRAEAERTLSQVNYYRLSAYWKPFLRRNEEEFSQDEQFRDGTTLTSAVELYRFDTRLRGAVFESP